MLAVRCVRYYSLGTLLFGGYPTIRRIDYCSLSTLPLGGYGAIRWEHYYAEGTPLDYSLVTVAIVFTLLFGWLRLSFVGTPHARGSLGHKQIEHAKMEAANWSLEESRTCPGYFSLRNFHAGCKFHHKSSNMANTCCHSLDIPISGINL